VLRVSKFGKMVIGSDCIIVSNQDQGALIVADLIVLGGCLWDVLWRGWIIMLLCCYVTSSIKPSEFIESHSTSKKKQQCTQT